jgi:hypothetical protein
MDQHDKAVMHSSFESDYRTPGDCFGVLNAEFHFGIDLAADRESALCERYLGPESNWADNALVTDWANYAHFGAQFLNPPFSKTLVNAYNTGRIKDSVGLTVKHEIDREKAKSYDIANWARKCWEESQKGATIVGVFPFAPQTDWYRQYVYGHIQGEIIDGRYPITWNGHAAREERRLPHRISFLEPDGTPTGNAGVNSVIIVWKPNHGIVGPWQPHQFYWSYR